MYSVKPSSCQKTICLQTLFSFPLKLLLLGITLLFVGCSTDMMSNRAALSPDQHLAKANQYVQQASESKYPHSLQYRLLAADSYTKAGRQYEASNVLREIINQEPNIDANMRSSIFEARLALLKQDQLRAQSLIKIMNKSVAQLTGSQMPTGNINAGSSRKIALLLPSHGPHAKAAKTIRDGFLAAYYKTLSHQPSEASVQVYDTSAEGGVAGAYQKALNDNVGLIVGPLTKPEVQEIAGMNLDVPVLALNTLSGSAKQGGSHSKNRFGNPASKLYQFGLMPEDEVFAVALHARQQGQKRALIIAPESEWGNRMAKAFSDSFESNGGKIVDTLMLSPNQDLSNRIRSALEVPGANHSEAHASNKDNSTHSKRDSKNALKSNSKRGSKNADAEDSNADQENAAGDHPFLGRRTDIDMIFLAASPEMGRQIKPLLNYYKADNLSVYATASIYSGTPTPAKDLDLNEVRFCDMPWVLGNSSELRETRKKVSELWPASIAQSPRYFALGMDAYHIASQITERSMPLSGLSGVTGDLKIDNEQHIQRRLVCAKFENGIPIPD